MYIDNCTLTLYDKIASEWDRTRQTAWGEFEFAKALTTVKSVLDAGCGNGRLVDWLRKNNFTGAYLGIDESDELIKRARNNFPKEKGKRKMKG